MYCQNCGEKLPDNAEFCPICGAPKVEMFQAQETPLIEKQIMADRARPSVEGRIFSGYSEEQKQYLLVQGIANGVYAVAGLIGLLIAATTQISYDAKILEMLLHSVEIMFVAAIIYFALIRYGVNIYSKKVKRRNISSEKRRRYG